MSSIPTDVLDHFHDIADAVAFLDRTYGDTLDEIHARRADQLATVITDWCDQQTQDPAVRMLVDAREARAAREAPPVTTAPRAKKPAVGEHVCPDCAKVCATAQGVAVHRARSHGIAGDRGRTRSPQTNGAHQCPDCPFTSTTPNGLTRHRRQQHGPVVDPPAAVETGGKIDNPNFDGHHRLAHERRVGHQIDAYCACGDNSGPTDREDARDWLHQHLDSTAA